MSGSSTTQCHKPYPAYKPSGIEWLGEVPAHWEVRRLKYSAPFGNGKLDNKPEGVTYVGLENIEPWTGELLLDYQPDSVDSTVVTFAPGDVLFGKLRPYLAKVASPDFEGTATSEVLVMRPLEECSQSYLAYCLLNAPYIRWIDTLTYGAKMPRVSPDEVACSFMPLPPLSEQQAIAAFLDRETARIDALIAKKERLIELLQEKRTALITRAVTKGLDPDAPMKPSGVAWLGEIPAHWETTKLRRLLTVVTYHVDVHPEQVYQEIGIRSWGRGIFHKDPVPGSQLGDKRVFELRPGELVLNIVFAWEGAVAIVSEGERGMIASHRFPTFQHTKTLVDSDYLFMFLQSEHGRGLMALNSPGAAGRNRTIRIDSFLDEEVPLPPLEEQREIVAIFRLDERRLQALADKVSEAVDRLKELRNALISAAVTGRIDVREEAGCK